MTREEFDHIIGNHLQEIREATLEFFGDTNLSIHFCDDHVGAFRVEDAGTDEVKIPYEMTLWDDGTLLSERDY